MAMQSYTRGIIAGMELAMRICRNQNSDMVATKRPEQAGGAAICVGVIRLVQVEIGAGRMPLPEFSLEEQEEMNRIS